MKREAATRPAQKRALLKRLKGRSCRSPPREIPDSETQVRRAFAQLDSHRAAEQARQNLRAQLVRKARADKLARERRAVEEALASVLRQDEAAAAESEASTPPTAASRPLRPAQRSAQALRASMAVLCEGEQLSQRSRAQEAAARASVLFAALESGGAVARADESGGIACEEDEHALARLRTFLFPTRWTLGKSRCVPGAEGGFKRLMRATAFAYRAEERPPPELLGMRDRYEQLVVLVSKHRRAGGAALPDCACLAAEATQTLKAAALGVGVPVVAAGVFTLSAAQRDELARDMRDPKAPPAEGPAGFGVTVLPLCYSLHSLLKELDHAECNELFASYEVTTARVSASQMLMCDSKPANFLVRREVGCPPRVYAADFDREHVFDPVPLPAAVLLLLHHLLMYLHVSAEADSNKSAGSRERWKELLGVRVGQLWLEVQRIAESDANTATLLRQSFLDPSVARPRTEPRVLGRVVDKVSDILSSYFFDFERYAKTDVRKKLCAPMQKGFLVVESLVGVAVPALACVF